MVSGIRLDGRGGGGGSTKPTDPPAYGSGLCTSYQFPTADISVKVNP